MADLTAAARSQVASGITATSLAKAETIKSNLLDQLLPPCRTASPTPSATPSTPSRPTKPGAKTTPAPSPTPTPTPSPILVPGVDCRNV
jgi:PPM family protein phosphatase